MSKKNICPVHGENPINQENAYIPEPLPDCTCDVGTTGPALEGKGNTPTGPALEGGGNTPVGPGV